MRRELIPLNRSHRGDGCGFITNKIGTTLSFHLKVTCFEDSACMNLVWGFYAVKKVYFSDLFCSFIFYEKSA